MATPFQHGRPGTPVPSQPEEDQAAFLKDARERCERFGKLYETTKPTRR